MPTRWHMMSEKQLSILIQGRNYARGNRQIIRIPRAFACISAGAPWLWRSVMQIDKVSQEPTRLRMLTAPFHGTFFSIGSSQWSLVEEAKYIEVLLASDLGWSPHVATTAGQASSDLGFLKRNLKKWPAAFKNMLTSHLSVPSWTMPIPYGICTSKKRTFMPWRGSITGWYARL